MIEEDDIAGADESISTRDHVKSITVLVLAAAICLPPIVMFNPIGRILSIESVPTSSAKIKQGRSPPQAPNAPPLGSAAARLGEPNNLSSKSNPVAVDVLPEPITQQELKGSNVPAKSVVSKDLRLTPVSKASPQTGHQESLSGVTKSEPRSRSPPPPMTITHADWLTKPSPEDVSRFYPEEAVRMNIEGQVLLNCDVHIDGSPTCRVGRETPAGQGFGAAAIKVSKYFKFTPQKRDGLPEEGNISLTLVFSLPK